MQLRHFDLVQPIGCFIGNLYPKTDAKLPKKVPKTNAYKNVIIKLILFLINNIYIVKRCKYKKLEFFNLLKIIKTKAKFASIIDLFFMCSSLEKAYTLLEQAIAISILAFLVMVMVMISDYQYDVSFYNDTEEKINQIEKSLISHMIRYSKDSNVVFGNPLPCPALITNSINLSTFGKSNSQYDDAGGDCLGSYKTDTSNLNNYYYGMVPVRTLGLPDDYAFDSWGRRFLFLINKDILNQEIKIC